MTEVEPGQGEAPEVPAENVATRAELLPEEVAVGSDRPQEQAEAILRESGGASQRPGRGHLTPSGGVVNAGCGGMESSRCVQKQACFVAAPAVRNRCDGTSARVTRAEHPRSRPHR